MKYDKGELSLIWLDSFIGLEYKHKIEIYNYIAKCGGISEGLKCAADYIQKEVGQAQYNTMQSSTTRSYLQFILDEFERKGVFCITSNSKNYPNRLKNIDCPPLVLYAKGNAGLLESKTFGIVGSRKSLPQSISLAKEYSNALLDGGITLVTGMAEGVDAQVLNSAVSSSGKVISVIAGGFDNLYPKSHAQLMDKVAAMGLMISEYPPQTIPKPYFFPVRNRIIAGLSDGVLIVSGAKKSGTLYTAEYAEEYGKQLFAIPYSPGIASGEGCNDLIKRGAILTDSPDDLIEFYNLQRKQKSISLSQIEKDILKTLSQGNMHIEKICVALSKSAVELTPYLSVLEIKGEIIKSGNVYGLVRSYSEE